MKSGGEASRCGVGQWDDLARMREMEMFGVQGITSNYPERFAMV